jgi:hypothetical protein
MADIQRQSQFDLGGKALTATNHHHNIKQQQDKSSATFNNSTFTSTEAFSIPPSLLSSARVEQYGQSTLPEFSSTFLVHDKRESFIPVEQLRNETTFVPHQGPSSLQLAPAAQHLRHAGSRGDGGCLTAVVVGCPLLSPPTPLNGAGQLSDDHTHHVDVAKHIRYRAVP